MADCVQRLAQEMVNSDYLWSILDANGKINLLRASMGLPVKRRDENNFKTDAPMVFDGIPSKKVVSSPSEISALQLEMMDKDTTRFNFAYSVESQVQDRTLLVKIHLMEYLISCNVLERVFSRFGILENIEILDPENEFHSKVCFKSKGSALEALDSINGRNIYDDCCKMELIMEKDFLFSRDRPMMKCSNEPETLSMDSIDEIDNLGDENLLPIESDEEIKIQGQEIGSSGVVQVDKESVFDACKCEAILQQMKQIDLNQSNLSDLEVNSGKHENSGDIVEINLHSGNNFDQDDSERRSTLVPPMEIEKALSSDFNEGTFNCFHACEFQQRIVTSESFNKLGIDEFKTNSMDFLKSSGAYQVFEEMTLRRINVSDATIQLENTLIDGSSRIFDPGDTDTHIPNVMGTFLYQG